MSRSPISHNLAAALTDLQATGIAPFLGRWTKIWNLSIQIWLYNVKAKLNWNYRRLTTIEMVAHLISFNVLHASPCQDCNKQTTQCTNVLCFTNSNGEQVGHINPNKTKMINSSFHSLKIWDLFSFTKLWVASPNMAYTHNQPSHTHLEFRGKGSKAAVFQPCIIAHWPGIAPAMPVVLLGILCGYDTIPTKMVCRKQSHQLLKKKQGMNMFFVKGTTVQPGRFE